MTRVDDLLAAPRGRALCAALQADGGDLFAAFGRAVAFAVYWQEPMDADRTSLPDAALRPAAERLLHSGEVGWWRSPVDLADQWYTGPAARGPRITGVAATLATWRQAQADAEWDAAALAQEDLSGTWWSTPRVRGGPPSTTRAVAGRGPVHLWLVEDETGETSFRSWPVTPTRDPRVFEVHGPDDWALLTREYPFDVTDSRAPDWQRATGRSGRWVIPDWPAVGGDFDAVHVSAWGWLTTAGRPVPVGGAASLLAGWSPDETFWLSDCLAVSGEPVDHAWDGDAWRVVS